MKSNEVSFARNLVKGKIAETVFAQMLRSIGQFTVLEFGYEKIIPELVGRGKGENDEMVEALRTAPDFAIINNKTKKVHLIEVKYRKSFSNSVVFKHRQANECMLESIVPISRYSRWFLLWRSERNH